MLNPRAYLEDCARAGLHDVWATGMPWRAVNSALNDKFNYDISKEGQQAFVVSTGLNWDNLDDSPNKSLKCPRCEEELSIPWTTCSMPQSSKEIPNELFDNGYGDSEFFYKCSNCSGEINHHLLQVAEFNKDIEQLISNDWPLKGTVVGVIDGLLTQAVAAQEIGSSGTFANRFVSLGFKTETLELIDNSPYDKLFLASVRDFIELGLLRINQGHGESDLSLSWGNITQEKILAISEMLSRYRNHHSIFAVDLISAVLRQSDFTNTMQEIDWIHSPILSATMSRVLLKYDRFMTIIGTFPTRPAIPTFDVDLAWHTHQLSPQSYYKYSLKKTKQFVDHEFVDNYDIVDDDERAEMMKSGDAAFKWFSGMYEEMYDEVYKACVCLYCEGKEPLYRSDGH